MTPLQQTERAYLQGLAEEADLTARLELIRAARPVQMLDMIQMLKGQVAAAQPVPAEPTPSAEPTPPA